MNYDWGAANELRTNRSRPRIHFGIDDLPALREKLSSGHGRTIVEAFRERVHSQVERVLEFDTDAELREATGEPRSKTQKLVKGGRTTGIVDMALIYLLDRDKKALKAVKRLFRVIPDFDSSGQGRLALSYNGVGLISQAYDMVAQDLEDDEKEKICSWAWEHGVQENLNDLSVRIFKGPGANIPMSGVLNAVQALLCLEGEPCVEGAEELWPQVIPMIEAIVHGCLGPNGYPEEDMGYGTLMTARLAHTVEILRRAGIYDVYEKCPRYAKFGRAMLHMLQPWGTHLTTTGDHGDDFGLRTFVLARLADETHDPTLIWLLTHLSDKRDIDLGNGMQVEDTFYSVLLADSFDRGKPPSETDVPTQFLAPRRGMVSFRSGWEPDDAYLAFDSSQRSPAAMGHEHASCGHFMVSALGEYFAIGPGRYNMEQNCHNVVLIDGKSGRSTDGAWQFMDHAGTLKEYTPGNFVDTALVDSTLQHDCYRARRRIGFVKGQAARPYIWIVDDINKNNQWAEYWWQFHACPENTIEIAEDRATVFGWRGEGALDVRFALPAPEQYPRDHVLEELFQDVAEPSSYEYLGSVESHMEKFDRPAEQVHYSAFRRPRLVARIAGYNGRLMSLLLPRRVEEPPPEVERIKSLPQSIAVRITFDGVEDVLIRTHEHGVLQAAGVKALGSWCVVRRDVENGNVLDYAIGDGTYFEVDGEERPIGNAD
ncbi:MAG: heparinase II/III family protein [Candidatus Brocadiia bacterium]